MHQDERDWIETSLIDSEQRKCIAKILHIDKKDVVKKGDNYTSELSRLTLKVLLRSGEIETRSVIYKCVPSTENRGKFIAESGLFIIEKRMYTEVLPLMERIRREKESGEPLWGGCLATSGYRTIMLEDLGIHGYKMGDRMKGLDFDHCKLVLKSLAKYHALGAVLRERGEIVTSDYEQHFMQKNSEMMSLFYKASFEGMATTIEETWKGEWLPYAAKLRSKAETVMAEVVSVLTADKTKFSTLCHGDCWVNNIMFKYADDGRPISVRFIDFQVGYIGNVGGDLQYFLTSSPSQECWDRKPEMLRIYQETLAESLDKFGYQGEKPSMEDVLEEYRRAGVFGMAIAITTVRFMKMPSKDVPDLEELTKQIDVENQSMKDIPDKISNTSVEYEELIKAVLLEANKKGDI